MPSRLPRANALPIPFEQSAAPAHLFAGTSGWAYTSWKPGFYPQDLPSRRFLEFYSRTLTSVEVNYTFSSDLKSGQLDGWLASVPAGFRFTFKAPQRITHFQRLADSEETLKHFLGSLDPARSTGKLGAILFQLPPNFKANETNRGRLAGFLETPVLGGHQLAFEFRHDSWFSEETFATLRGRNAALCIAESESLVTPETLTASHAYYRLRLPGGYSDAKVESFAEKFANPASDTYIYFKHEDAPTGALNAAAMLRLIQGAQA